MQITHAQAVFPIIFDDSSDLVGSVGLEDGDAQEGGLLAQSNVRAVLLSMSGYGKPQYSELKDYESSQPSQDPMYLAAYAQPGLGQPHLPSSSNPYSRHTEQVPFTSSALFQPRTTFEAPESQYAAPASRQLPTVASCTPRQGPQGTRIFIQLLSSCDLETSPPLNFYAMFATRRCSSSLAKLEPQSAYQQQYLLTADAPTFSATGWNTAQVPLRLQVLDDSSSELGTLDLGSFTYTDVMQPSAQPSPQDVSRKRKISTDSAEASRLPTKRTSSQQLRPANLEMYQPQQYLQQTNSGYMQQPSLEADSSLGNLMPNYGRSHNQPGYQPHDSPQRISHHLSNSSASSLSQLRGPSPQTPSWSPLHISAAQPSKSPLLAAPSVSRISSMSSPSIAANPPLIRTSTLQQSPSPGATPAGTSAPASFNPYAMYPHKAILKINGDLDSMAEEWTEDEFDAKRRLVQFWRTQSGSTINTTFKPVAPEERQPNSICISCIWWESKKECYVTSVDTIYLLESLVTVRFTVEEKNRIRRNLEGFRPMTVSKGKSDSEDFFKLIMGFPNPKPRNIEKDVKVFPWKILAHALKKIIGKYSASYSSTASALPTSVNPTYGAATPTDLGSDLLSNATPHTASASSVFTAGLTSTKISPHVSHNRLAVPYSSAGTGLLQIPHASANAYSYQANSHIGGSAAAASMMGAAPRDSWEYVPYNETTAGSVNAGMHGIYYQPHNDGTDGTDEASSTGYQMTHTSSGP